MENTPEPWRLEELEPGQTGESAERYVIAAVTPWDKGRRGRPREVQIATVHRRPEGKITLANALLIAAAPVTYAALKVALAWLRDDTPRQFRRDIENAVYTAEGRGR